MAGSGLLACEVCAVTPMLSTEEVVSLCGTTYRVIDYWVRRGVLTPVRPANGQGNYRAWHPDQLPTIRAALALRSLGAPLEVVARAVSELAAIATDQWEGIVYVSPAGDVWSWLPGGHAWALDLGAIVGMPGPVSLDFATTSP